MSKILNKELKGFLLFVKKKTNLSNREIEKESGITVQTILNILKNDDESKVRVTTLDALKDAFPDLAKGYYKNIPTTKVSAKVVNQILDYLTKEKGITQKRIGEILGMKSESTLSNWRRKKDNESILLSRVLPLISIDFKVLEFFPDDVAIPKKYFKVDATEKEQQIIDTLHALKDEIVSLKDEIVSLKNK